ncbi:MAG TPA: response regulator transcription factor [Acidimicrobiia bacterium]|nr:response regulator transcription factor [Acidimicrobiia bacterium]
MARARIEYRTISEIEAEPPPESAALLVELGSEPRRRLRAIEGLLATNPLPVLLIAEPEHVDLLGSAVGLGDFILAPVQPAELELRLHRLTRAEGTDEIHHFKDLELNLLTYQATLDSAPVDLTYMEYELLRFFVEHPHRVWSREQLLSKVWGYEYFGGARTVDVHVRRLRAKLGEHRASWITTVRSVGYRFG